jgi:ketosteroid isomerase-like protein
MRFVLSLLLIVLISSSVPAFAQSWTSDQQEIWRVEEAMWQRDTAKDLTWIDTYLHANATSWGIDHPVPRNKASVTRWDKYAYSNATVLEYELFPLSITVMDDVAVVHYRYRIASEDLNKRREIVTGRYTDVLVREDGRWLILTVVGGDDPGSAK